MLYKDDFELLGVVALLYPIFFIGIYIIVSFDILILASPLVFSFIVLDLLCYFMLSSFLDKKRNSKK